MEDTCLSLAEIQGARPCCFPVPHYVQKLHSYTCLTGLRAGCARTGMRDSGEEYCNFGVRCISPQELQRKSDMSVPLSTRRNEAYHAMRFECGCIESETIFCHHRAQPST